MRSAPSPCSVGVDSGASHLTAALDGNFNYNATSDGSDDTLIASPAGVVAGARKTAKVHTAAAVPSNLFADGGAVCLSDFGDNKARKLRTNYDMMDLLDQA